MRAGIIAAAMLAVAIGGAARAADNVKIGVIYPLTGNAASAGQSAKDAVELGAEIVNTAHPELKGLPLGETAGLPNLGGAKIELDEADHQGNPPVGQQQTVRLITQDKVAAMLGAYHSSVSLAATAVAERQGMPFLVGGLGRAQHHRQRGFKWTFRTGPIAPDFAKAYTDFLNELKKAGKKIDSHRHRQREHRLRHLGRRERPRRGQGRQHQGGGADRLQRQQLGRVGAGAAAQEASSPTR